MDLEPEIAAHVVSMWYPSIGRNPCVVATKEADLMGIGEPTHARVDFVLKDAIVPLFIPIKDYLRHQQNYLETIKNGRN